MSVVNERPIDFCLHLAAAVRQGKKTLAYKPIPFASANRYLTNGTRPPPMYGSVGDRLWIRELFAIGPNGIDYPATRASTKYDAKINNAPGPVVPAASMTRAQASIVLKIASIVVVRLKDDLTEESARAAGMDPRARLNYREEFITQWDAAYGNGLAVARNPPVWRITFSIV